MAIEKFTLVLDSARMIAPNVKHLVFKRDNGLPLAFTAGQFVTFLLPSATGEIKRRSYSIANPPQQGSELEIAISYVKGGIASETLFNLKPGDSIAAMGPAGKLVLQNETSGRLIFVGTGTGVAPYRAMLPELSRLLQTTTLKVVILQGVQYRQDLLYGQDFRAFAEQNPAAQFFAHFSREDAIHLAEDERRGYVQYHFADLNLNPAEDVVYLCGNPNMIDQAFADLQARGFQSTQLRREKYISSN